MSDKNIETPDETPVESKWSKVKSSRYFKPVAITAGAVAALGTLYATYAKGFENGLDMALDDVDETETSEKEIDDSDLTPESL